MIAVVRSASPKLRLVSGPRAGRLRQVLDDLVDQKDGYGQLDVALFSPTHRREVIPCPASSIHGLCGGTCPCEGWDAPAANPPVFR